MRYGSETKTTTIDDNGSTITTKTNILEHKVVNPIRKRFEIREKVHDKKEEMTEYIKFSDSIDENKIDPEFRIEYTKHGKENGYYYIVKCWSTISYE